MKQHNLYSRIDSPTYENKNKLAPQWPFRLLISADSGSGKTNMCVNMVLGDLIFDDLYIFAADINEPIYEWLQQQLPEAHFSDNLESLDLDTFKDTRDRQTLMIFDDFVHTRNQQPILEVFKRGRKLGISCIYISQSYFGTPKMIRLNCNYFCIYRIKSRKEARAVVDDCCAGIEYDQFKSIFDIATKKNPGDKFNSFLVIDTRTNNDALKFRRGWSTGIELPEQI